jgi:hypothetical protein
VAELGDALDLGSSGASRGGSSPSARTKVRSHDVGRTREDVKKRHERQDEDNCGGSSSNVLNLIEP